MSFSQFLSYVAKFFFLLGLPVTHLHPVCSLLIHDFSGKWIVERILKLVYTEK